MYRNPFRRSTCNLAGMNTLTIQVLLGSKVRSPTIRRELIRHEQPLEHMPAIDCDRDARVKCAHPECFVAQRRTSAESSWDACESQRKLGEVISVSAYLTTVRRMRFAQICFCKMRRRFTSVVGVLKSTSQSRSPKLPSYGPRQLATALAKCPSRGRQHVVQSAPT